MSSILLQKWESGFGKSDQKYQNTNKLFQYILTNHTSISVIAGCFVNY